MLSISRNVRVCVCLSVCLLFEVVSDLKNLFIKGVKSPCKRKFFFSSANLGLNNHESLSQSSQECYGISATIRIIFLRPLPKVGCPKHLKIWNPWGKVNKRSGLTFENFC